MLDIMQTSATNTHTMVVGLSLWLLCAVTDSGWSEQSETDAAQADQPQTAQPLNGFHDSVSNESPGLQQQAGTHAQPAAELAAASPEAASALGMEPVEPQSTTQAASPETASAQSLQAAEPAPTSEAASASEDVSAERLQADDSALSATKPESEQHLPQDSGSASSEADVAAPELGAARRSANVDMDPDAQLASAGVESDIAVDESEMTDPESAPEVSDHASTEQAVGIDSASPVADSQHSDQQYHAAPGSTPPSVSRGAGSAHVYADGRSDNSDTGFVEQPTLLQRQHATINSWLLQVHGSASALLHRQAAHKPQHSNNAVQPGPAEVQSQPDEPTAELSQKIELAEQQYPHSADSSQSGSSHEPDFHANSPVSHAESHASPAAEFTGQAQPQHESESSKPKTDRQPSFEALKPDQLTRLMPLRALSTTAAAATAAVAAAVAVLLWLSRRSSSDAADDAQHLQADDGHDLANAMQNMSLTPESHDTTERGTPMRSASVAEQEVGSEVGEGSQLGSAVQTGGRARKPRGKRELSALGKLQTLCQGAD